MGTPCIFLFFWHKDFSAKLKQEVSQVNKEERRRRRKKIIIAVVLAILILGFLLHRQVLENAFAPTAEGAIYRVETKEKAVALTFDIVWEPAETSKILAVLDRYRIQSTFFLTGEWVRNNPDLAREILVRGHEIGQHSQTHRNMAGMKEEEVVSEFDLVEETFREELSVLTSLFRPPYGEVDQSLADFARNRGYQVILWSISPQDWLDPGVDKIVSRVVKNLHSGAIILFHTSSSQAAEALPVVIQSLKMKDYGIYTVSTLLQKRNK